MMPAQSTFLGQRVEHVWHETHCQIEFERNALSVSPKCSMRISRFGTTSMLADIGQPAVHLPHW
jgi:hypothetical protein